MTYRLIVQPLAASDIASAALWYEQQRSGLGDEFLAEMRNALHRAAESPKRFPRFRRRPDVRRVLTTRFPYRAFFILGRNEVVVFRVLHAARNDQEWRSNAPERSLTIPTGLRESGTEFTTQTVPAALLCEGGVNVFPFEIWISSEDSLPRLSGQAGLATCPLSREVRGCRVFAHVAIMRDAIQAHAAIE